jgi:type IV pilus assembly protein PilY1
MNIQSFFKCTAKAMRPAGAAVLAGLLGLAFGGPSSAALTTTTTLGDTPVYATVNVPGNLALVLSVEYPTAISVANLGDYADASTYLGYFDPVKCYNYVYNSTTPSSSYFAPAALSTGANSHSCSGMWSGNFMNWATMQTIDPFRWALTGGYRSVDTHPTTGGSYPYTILEKAWGSFQGAFSVSGGYWNSTSFPFRGTDQASPNNKLPSSLVPTVTPFTTWNNFNSAIWANGNQMVFSGTGTSPSTQNTGYYSKYGATVSGSNVTVTSSVTSSGSVYNLENDLTGANVNPQPVTFRVWIRVSVCDASKGVAYLESNCTQYGSIYKPEGLLQKYSNQMRYADLSYLNADGEYQQGGVLREPMGFIGPTYPQPLSSTVITNTQPEWSATTGVQGLNPDPAAASASSVSWSGVINYLNKFGEYTATVSNGSNTNNNTNTYMKNDNVSELYYAAVRYFENLGNVSLWSTLQSGITGYPTTVQLDGFPAVTTWTDPIAYSCQKNFILGIGDDHTHYDFNVANNGGASDQYITRNAPAFSDSFNQSNTWTSDVETLEGLSGAPWWNYYNSGGSYSTYFMSGLAYGAHVNDIRSDLTGTQTISTYWMDVEEYGYPENENQYYLATKYGGFTVPSAYTFNTALTQSWWDTSNNTIKTHVSGTYDTAGTYTFSPQPDNYFLAGQASTMVSGLQSAFANIATAIASPYSTSFSLSSPIVATAGELSFSSQYNSSTWTSVITGSMLTFNGGAPTLQQSWVSSGTLQNQLSGTGNWQAPFNGTTGRNVATWNGSSGITFEFASLSSTQKAALLPSYSSGPTAATAETNYLAYLRGDQTNEVGSTVSGSTHSLRARTLFLGDIVDANLAVAGTPGMGYSEANNPGYTAFTTKWTTTTPRPTMVYAGANDGMVHGFVGSSGAEQFAYVPSALFQGPTGTPQTNGLAALGNPSFTHHFYVDATPDTFDVDLTRTNGATTTAGTANWRTLLIGGLGKGGASYYAIDVTNPAGMTSESAVASDVLWEFTDPTMGYSFATPVVVKTVQYGWVVILTSGYDDADGYGYLYIVNPTNGALLQKIKTPIASSGLTQASAFVQDYTNYTADSVYVGDLNGQLWRFDLTAATGNYPAPTLIATLTDPSGNGNAQPVTSAPLIAIHPTTRQRYVMVGTGQLLSSTDVSSTQVQTFYAIIDGTGTSFATVTAPTTRANLQPVTNLTAGITVAAGYNGWYYDLPAGFRVVSQAVTYNGIVAFSTLAMTSDPCSPQGSSDVYALNYSTGVSVLNSTYVAFGVAVNDLQFVSNHGTVELIAGTTGNATTPPGPTQIPGNFAIPPSALLLNWREIPSAE